jgi:hypothetical protein
MTELYNDDESGEFISPLFPTPHKIPPFDPSSFRDTDTQLCLAACSAMGCESITIHQARKWAEIEKRRIQYARYAAKAKARKAARRAS